jgi:hypothetical protein
MSDKISQRERVERDLKKNGFVSRNFYVNLPYNKILRLGAIIEKMRKEGWDIKTDETTNKGDCIYRVKPKRVESYVVGTGEDKYIWQKNIWV